MTKRDDPDPEPDRDPDNAIAPAPTGGALTSLQALQTALANVDTSSVAGRSGLPMLQFKRDGVGTWHFGQRRTVVEEGSAWAINPMTFKRGYICFNDANKVVGERLVSVTQPMPDPAELPDKGCEWQEQWSVNLKCVSGADAGTEVVYKPTTVGGIQAIAGMIEMLKDRLNSGEHGDNIVAVVHLQKDSYQHSQHGRVWYPVMTVFDWMSLSGRAPAPASPPASPPPTEEPRRRRVA